MKLRIRNMARCGCAAAVLAVLTACGGGDSGPPPPPPPATYTIGGTVTGLTGSGPFLHPGFGNALPVSAAGTFPFASRMLSGTSASPTASPLRRVYGQRNNIGPSGSGSRTQALRAKLRAPAVPRSASNQQQWALRLYNHHWHKRPQCLSRRQLLSRHL